MNIKKLKQGKTKLFLIFFFSKSIFHVFKNNDEVKKTLNRYPENLKSDFRRSSFCSLATINNNNSNVEINIPREDSYNSLQISYSSLQFNETLNVAANTH